VARIAAEPIGRFWIRNAAWLAILLARLLTASADEPPLERYRFEQMHMGMAFTVTLYADSQNTANQAAEAAFARIAQLDAILSDYKQDSELSRLSRTAGQDQPEGLSNDLFCILSRSQSLACATDGAFDVTIGPVVRLWRRARRGGQMPSAERLAEAREAVGYQYLRLDSNARTAMLTKPKMRLDLGGIAVGYAVDEALDVLRAHNVHRAMVDGSGDIAVGDSPPDEPRGWKIGIAPNGTEIERSRRYVWLIRAAISTSSDAMQHVEIDGKRYSHIVDPLTGLGLTDQIAVTVVAHDCMTADSLATAVSVLGVNAGIELIDRTHGAAALVLRTAQGRELLNSSRGWNDLDVMAN